MQTQELPTIPASHDRQVRALREKKYRDELSLCIVEGVKGVRAAIESDWNVTSLLINREQYSELPDALRQVPVEKVYAVTSDQMERLSSLSTPPGILAIVEQQIYSLDEVLERRQSILYCAGLADPGNLGTCMRTAEWFGVKAILCSEGTADFFNPKVVQASMGSLFHLLLSQDTSPLSTLTKLRRAGYVTVVTTPHAQAGSLPSGSPFCLIVGSESHGVPTDLQAACEYQYTIPRIGDVESLNAAVATGIALYDLSRSTLPPKS